jgi:hypothetical protein
VRTEHGADKPANSILPNVKVKVADISFLSLQDLLGKILLCFYQTPRNEHSICATRADARSKLAIHKITLLRQNSKN